MNAKLDEVPAADAVFGRWTNFWIKELEAESESEQNAYLKGIQGGMMLTAALFRKRLLDNAPPFPTHVGWQGTMTWILELRNSGARLDRIDAITLERRVHFNNFSRKKSLNELAELALSLHRAARKRRDLASSNSGA